MKMFKKFIVIVLLCMQSASLVAMKAPKAMGKNESRILKQALQTAMNPNETKLLIKALNAEINKTSDFYNSKTSNELNSIIKAVNIASANEKILNSCARAFKKTPAEINKLLKGALKNATKAWSKLGLNKPVTVKAKAALKEMASWDRNYLKRALSDASSNSLNFYTARTDKELNDVIDLAHDALMSAADQDFFSKELQKTIPQIRELLNKVIYDAGQALEKKNVRLIEIGRQEGLVPVPAVQKAAVQKMAPREDLQQSPEAHKKGGDNYSFYIMLDVQDVNAKGQPIQWQELIDLITSRLEDAQFIPTDYRHITLAWYTAKLPLRPDVIAKIEKALTRANEILKIFYPKGARGISLRDGASISQGGGVSFRVAKSVDLENIQATIAQFLRFEGIDLFNFNTFENKMPFHVTLGVIKPFNEARQIKNELERLYAPAGTRAYRDEDILVDKFRATQALPHTPYQQVGAYAF